MLVVLLILLVLLGACREPAPPPDGFVIAGAWVLDGTGSEARAVDVVVEGDTVVELTTDAPGHYPRVEASGLTLAPDSSTLTATATPRSRPTATRSPR